MSLPEEEFDPHSKQDQVAEHGVNTDEEKDVADEHDNEPTP